MEDKNQNKLKMYLEAMALPFLAFVAVYIVGFISFDTTRERLGLFLFLFLLFSVIALRNFYILMSKDDNPKEVSENE
jgi:hypothetical protein